MNDLFSLAGRTALDHRRLARHRPHDRRRLPRAGRARLHLVAQGRGLRRRPPRELAVGSGTCVCAARRRLDAGGRAARSSPRSAAREPRLDILVNNAGAAWGETFDTFPEKGWDKVVDLNLKTPFFLTQALTALLRAAAQRRAAGQGDQHRLDRRHLGQPAGDLLVRREQGRPDPAHPAHGAAPGAGEHRRQRDRARRLRLRDEPGRARPRRRGRGSASRRGGSAATRTWPARRSTSPRAPATTWSARPWSSTAA